MIHLSHQRVLLAQRVRLVPRGVPASPTSCLRCLLFSSQSPDSSKNKTDDLRSSAWQRGARRVKEDVTAPSRERELDPYYHRIRETHDPTLHLKTLEDELKSTIGQALRRQADKILQARAMMDRERESYADLCRTIQAGKNRAVEPVQGNTADDSMDVRQAAELVRECAQRHNQYRAQALQARWELMVHRQAAGFLVNNHNVVYQTFPIGDALPVDGDSLGSSIRENATSAVSTAARHHDETTETRIPDQLDWWQRIGRWR